MYNAAVLDLTDEVSLVSFAYLAPSSLYLQSSSNFLMNRSLYYQDIMKKFALGLRHATCISLGLGAIY